MSDKIPQTPNPETVEDPETESPDVIAHSDEVEAYPCSTACNLSAD